MAFTAAQAKTRLRALSEARVEVVQDLATEAEPEFITRSLILAMALRESSATNITGDFGHGRGYLQIDDRFHQPWLRSHAGCDSGSWRLKYSVREGGVLPPGRVPGLTAQTRYAILLLTNNARFGRANGVKGDHIKRFAVASYNCGAGNALRSYREGGIRTIDRRTANGDYSKDVLINQEVVRDALRSLGWF